MNAHPSDPNIHQLWENGIPTLKRLPFQVLVSSGKNEASIKGEK